jgi:hypothetical protein
MNAMAFEIAERGGKAVATGKEVLIDAENRRAGCIAAFIQGKLQKLEEPSFHSRTGDALPLCKPVSADAIKVFAVNALPVGFRSATAWPNAGKTLPEGAPTGSALVLPALQFQADPALAPVLVPKFAPAFVLRPQIASFTVRTRYFPHEHGADSIPPAHFFDFCNLVAGQAQQSF